MPLVLCVPSIEIKQMRLKMQGLEVRIGEIRNFVHSMKNNSHRAFPKLKK